MRLLAILGLVVAALGSGFTIPEGQPDGVYEVHVEDGVEVHNLIRAVGTNQPGLLGSPLSAKLRRSLLETRTNYMRTICANQATLNQRDCDGAVSDLATAQCGSGNPVPSGRNFYAIRNCVVVYFCNFRSHTQICGYDSVARPLEIITRTCGLYRPGWVDYWNDNEYSDYYSIGYEDYCGAGRRFCGNGVG